MTSEALSVVPEETEETQEPQPYSVAVKPSEGYEVVDAVVFYRHESAAQLPIPDLAANLRKSVEARFPGQYVIGTTEQRAKKTRAHQATHIWVDSTQSAEKREKSGTRTGKPKDEGKAAVRALQLAGKLLNDKEFQAEARALGVDARELARDRACSEIGIEVAELRKLLQSYLA